MNVPRETMRPKEYDVIVVGAGHAGCEAAWAAGKLGSKVLLITMNMTNMAQMSCNPSIGGIAKGQMVREIDALGGMTGIVADRTMIQFRMLNKSKGPAMWSPRAQNDRILFSQEWRSILESNSNIDFWQDSVTEILVQKERISGIRTAMGIHFKAKSVILANGTFLNGIIYIGEKKYAGGRIGEATSLKLTDSLERHGMVSNRMKTGTPVRVDGRSLDFSLMDEQKGDIDPGKFSFTNTPELTKQRSCYLAYTSTEVHDTLKKGFEKSPLFTGRIKGRGPRYCPSIEDKIERFASKERHQLFIEPEGWRTIEYYVNGFSSSLPEEIQFKALRQVQGFRNAKFFRPGYAIEYDYFPPFQLKNTLETKNIENLYLAGQINGTTGYEEAAAQGIVAGINAHNKLSDQREFILNRTEAYIGVLIDDLITKGTEEPYRMFTSRAEYRTLLRQDNADWRLTKIGFQIGLATKEQYHRMVQKYEMIDMMIKNLKLTSIEPNQIDEFLKNYHTNSIKQKTKLSNILLRPQISLVDMVQEISFVRELLNQTTSNLKEELEEADIQIKYEGYIEKEKELAEKVKRLDSMVLDPSTDYQCIQSLSLEAREKLQMIKPRTIGQASRISGVSPSDISVLIVFLGR